MGRKEKGSAVVELAIVFPILLLLFVGTAELGRLFYTYTTLAKATKSGARYLSNSRDFTSSDAPTAAAALQNAQSLVVCGYEDCTGVPPIVPGLSTNNVKVTLFTQTEGSSLVRYVKVEIVSTENGAEVQGYRYKRGVFTLDGVTGASGSTSVYKLLGPKTTMRYML
jgi:Flp pilus assembly protein TadG